jgi:hypothetical protein
MSLKSFEDCAVKSIVNYGLAAMAETICCEDIERNPVSSAVWSELQEALPSCSLEELILVHNAVGAHDYYPHIEALQERLLKKIKVLLPSAGDERLEEIRTYGKALGLVEAEKKHLRDERRKNPKSLGAALNAVMDMDRPNDAVRLLKPWLKDASNQTSLEGCLFLANMAYQARLSMSVYTDELVQVLDELYGALIKSAKELDSSLHAKDEGSMSRAEGLVGKLNLHLKVAADVFRERCTNEAIGPSKTIDEITEAWLSNLTDGEKLLSRAAELANSGSRGSFDNLYFLYARQERLGLDRRKMVRALAEHANECGSLRILLGLYYENWQDAKLKQAIKAILKRIAELS